MEYLSGVNEIMPLITAGIGAVYGCWRFFLRPYLENKKPFADLPMAPHSHYLAGHLKLLLGDLDKTQEKLVENKNALGRAGYWLGPKQAVVVTRWQDARAVLNAESYKEMNPIARKRLKKLIPNTILAMNGKQWKHNRAAINKSFTPKGLHASTDAMIEITETVCESLKERVLKECTHEDGSYQTEIEKLMKLITIDVFGKATFSKDFGCTKNLQPNEFAAAFDSIGGTGLSGGKFNKAKQTIYNYVENMVKERQDEGTAAEKKDLLTDIIHANTNKDGKISSDEVLRDVVATVLFAGYDTTSVTLTYALHMLSQNPDIAERCLEEIASVQTLRDFDDLVYCKAVITETLRLYPSAPQVTRTLKKPVKLPDDGFVIPAGTTVMIPIWSVHHSDMNFSRPLEFLPERWVSKEIDADGSSHWVDRDPSCVSSSPVPAGNPKSFLAFSGGGRNCPGMKFAKQEAVVILAGLLQTFEFESLPGYQLRIERTGGIQHPRDCMPMKIKLRDAASKSTTQ